MKSFVSRYRNTIISQIILVVITCFIYIPIMEVKHVTKWVDYQPHASLARLTVESGTIQTPHFLWQLFIIGTKTLFNLSDYNISSLFSIAFIYCFLSLSIYNVYIRYTNNTIKEQLLAIYITICTMIATPILLPLAIDKHLYFGYIGLATYHNPTIVVLKFVTVIQFFTMIRGIFSKENKWFSYVFSATMITLVSLSKPSYTICLIPSLFILLLYSFYSKIFVDKKYIFLSLILPSLIVILFQYYFTYQSSSSQTLSDSSIIFAPLAVLTYYTKDFLLLKFILSIAFPLLVYSFYLRHISKYVHISWLILLFGFILMYFFAESKSRMYHANFFWSAQIGLFICFISSILFIFHNKEFIFSRENKYKNSILFIIFHLHIISGIFFYYLEYIAKFSSEYW